MDPIARLNKALIDLDNFAKELHRIRDALLPKDGATPHRPELTLREQEVLEMLEAGDSRKAISLSLGIHLSRVGQIIDNLRLKGVRVPDGSTRVRLRRTKVLEAARKARAENDALIEELYPEAVARAEALVQRAQAVQPQPKPVKTSLPPVEFGDVDDEINNFFGGKK
jgi:hypothetical protein